ncbi:hypothetical protein [Kitasatospora sp. NPDC088783]|uniref:hypothetical protein n=1 Tax=Kitasatospora sp. NPDC088783 TaxID=3364077 RepID=UPI00381AB714
MTTSTADDRQPTTADCPMRITVTEIRARRSTDEPWGTIQLLPGSPQENILTQLLLKGLHHDLRGVFGLIDPGSRREVEIHPAPCPLCRHRAQPGPRLFGLWNTEAWLSAEQQQGWREVEARQLIDLPNAAVAESWMHDLARRFVDRRGLGGRAEVHMFQVPAAPELPARYGLLVAEAGSELWLWTARPRTPDELRVPDRVLRLAADGSVTDLTGAQAAAGRPRVDPRAEARTSYSPFRTVEGTGGRRLTWFEDGRDGLLVSVYDPADTAPPRRVLADGRTEGLGDGLPGLVVFGRHVEDRPPLSVVTELAPGFADLVPALSARRGTKR